MHRVRNLIAAQIVGLAFVASAMLLSVACDGSGSNPAAPSATAGSGGGGGRTAVTDGGGTRAALTATGEGVIFVRNCGAASTFACDDDFLDGPANRIDVLLLNFDNGTSLTIEDIELGQNVCVPPPAGVTGDSSVEDFTYDGNGQPFANVLKFWSVHITKGAVPSYDFRLGWDPEPAAFCTVTPPPDTDGDGVPDDVDACVNSDQSPTVVIGGIDSGVTNVLFDDGCTIADLIAALAADVATHGDFVSAVANLLNTLKTDGVLTGKEKGAIQSAAAMASIP